MARNHLMILREHMERLESSLEDTDLVTFALKLLQWKIVSKDVKDNFDCLDSDHLESDIKVRYLLQQVCKRVREDDKVYDRLVRVLSRLGGGVKDVCEAMRKELDRVERAKASDGAEVGFYLTERDILGLVELLVTSRHKWEEISVALALPECVRFECSNLKSDPLKLTKVLREWISGSYKNAKSATLENLREALSSEIVGLHNISLRLLTFAKSVDTLPEVEKTHSYITPQIHLQSYDTEVAEGKSTLLEVQVSSSECESYQWSKDGQPLLDGADFSGVSSNILYIDRACQATEGMYACCVCNGSRKICSDEINLMVIKLSIEEEDLVKLLDCLLNSEVISRCIYNKFTSLDQVHLEPDIKVRYLLQQVCERVREDDKVYDRLVRVLRRLDGTLRDICNIMRKRVDRDKEDKVGYAGTTYGVFHSLLELDISINPLPTTNRACSDIDPEMYTEVAECKSTFLEVQVSSSGCESYQWSKDGQPLLDGADFSGVSSNMLYINRASQGTEGKYSCCASNGSETVCSDEVNLMVIYPPEKEHLIKLYSLMESEVPKDSWPPEGNSTFINLVLIKQSPISRCLYYTVRGDMDDILESKEVVEYEEVFKEYREGALVLVEGRPGSGKTTLVHKVTRDWATGRKVLQGAKIVFLITLRLLNFSKKDQSLLEVLEVFYGFDVLRKSVEHDLQECGGKGACFIIDGLDEYQQKEVRESVIHQLIDKKCLPFSMVIVASRPVATNELRRSCSRRVEVIGFTKSQINDYVETYPFNSSDKVVSDMDSGLKLYLDQHPNILHMCYLPVHAAMICFLFSQLEGNIPHTETQIYEQFTIATLLRRKTRAVEPRQLKSLKDLCGEEELQFRSICKLAFDMIMNSQQVVSQSDAQVSLSDATSSVLGLLTVEHTSRHYGLEHLYTFHHLTFQEFLAAFHITGLEEQEQVDILSINKYDKLRNVRKFYCGLIGLGKGIILQKNNEFLEGILGEDEDEDDGELIYKVQCAFESQLVELCDYVVGDGSLCLGGSRITPSDFTALGYIISTASNQVSKLSLKYCTWDNDGVMAFSSMITRGKLHFIKCLEVSDYLSDDYKALNALLCQLPYLEELSLLEELKKSDVHCFTRGVQLSQLRILNIQLPLAPCSHPEEVLKLLTFGSPNIKQVYCPGLDSNIDFAMWKKWLCYAFGFQVFKDSDISWLHLYNSDEFSSLPQERFSCCSEVVLVNCGIDDEGTEILANRLNISVLEKLVLDFNRISDSGAVAVAGCIASCSVVQEVSIQCNSIGDSGAIALADALVHCSSLRRLDLQGNRLGDKGAVAIAKAAEGLSNLDLYLHNVNITEGVERVLEYRASTKIRAMVFGSSWDAISDAGIDALRSALKCGTLPTLKISDANVYNIEILVAELENVRNISGFVCNDVTDDSLPTLCGIIKSMNNLQHLECSGIDDISSNNSQLLSDCLKLCKNIRSLSLRDHKNVSIQSSLLLDVVKCCANLQSLDISGCRIGSVGVALLFDDHQCWVNLHTLNLSINEIGSEGVALLFDDHQCWINLHTLNLRSNKIGSDGAQVLSKVLVHCKNLHCLDLTGNDIGDDGAVALAETLKDLTSLLELRLVTIGITSQGALALVEVVRYNHLQHLDLSWNSIGLESIAALVDVICADSLLTLKLSSNDLLLEGAVSLSARLKSCSLLVELNISHNNIGSQGMSSLAEGLQYCTNLQVLSLNNNNITSDGVAAIVGVMKRCRYLQELDLSQNSIGVDGAAVLVGGWQHKSMLTLYLDGNLGDPHESALEHGEKCCSSCDHLLELYCKNYYMIIEAVTKFVSSC